MFRKRSNELTNINYEHAYAYNDNPFYLINCFLVVIELIIVDNSKIML
jgi:hypothetical protein